MPLFQEFGDFTAGTNLLLFLNLPQMPCKVSSHGIRQHTLFLQIQEFCTFKDSEKEFINEDEHDRVQDFTQREARF